MSKLPDEHKFLDLSDYGRPAARWIAQNLKNTKCTPIGVTWLFILSGTLGVLGMYYGYFWLAAFFLVLKSVLDAADGELARLKNTPSYTGRYFDSIADILLNALIFGTLYLICDISLIWAILGFLGVQLQGTLYNYYYVILRNKVNGDTTSRVFETETPKALAGEDQRKVNVLFKIYRLLYGAFDMIIYRLDTSAPQGKKFPKWLMTAVSSFGLGFQLLLIGLLLILGSKELIIPFFVVYSLMIFIFIGIRKSLNT
ncbi:MAG: CDP-alcohol phosphatidyltransferase family protein [Flavobacteriaceae bacterium]|nr:CDP-alcohol phosphatidyltransferase family protein [Flavobacteriaceae bacterium]